MALGLWVLRTPRSSVPDHWSTPHLLLHELYPCPHPGPLSVAPNPFLLQFEIRQLRAHLAQQDLDLAAEREEALRAPQVLHRPCSRYHVVEETAAEGIEGIVEQLQPSPGELPMASPSSTLGAPLASEISGYAPSFLELEPVTKD